MKKFIIYISALIAFDQGSKLLVFHFLGYDTIILHAGTRQVVLIENLLEIHPFLHTKNNLLEKYLVLLAVFALSVLMYRFCSYFSQKYIKLVRAYIVLILSGTICSVIFDGSFWGGSLDFICKYYVRGNEFGHYIFDLKDVYIGLSLITLFCIAAVFTVKMARKGKAGLKQFASDLTNWIKKGLPPEKSLYF